VLTTTHFGIRGCFSYNTFISITAIACIVFFWVISLLIPGTFWWRNWAIFGHLAGQSSLGNACGSITEKNRIFGFTTVTFLFIVAIAIHPNTPAVPIIIYPAAKSLHS
jgi:hypothetical protein